MEIRSIRDAFRFAPDKMQKSSLYETSRLWLDVYGLEPGQAQKIHAHDASDKIYLVLEGRVLASVGGEERELGAEQAVLAPAGVPHGVRNAGDSRAALLVMTAPPFAK
jgi:mannose-6-phosphate isomerase-like protein (cupin superfamily)